MYKDIEEWINHVDFRYLPEETRAFCFNLYDDGDNVWSMELIGSKEFDPEDDDWACIDNETFDTRDAPFELESECGKDEVLKMYISALKEYLEKGMYADELKSLKAVGVGFVDDDIEILYQNDFFEEICEDDFPF